jgi:diacylglycerol kinase family enzyme
VTPVSPPRKIEALINAAAGTVLHQDGGGLDAALAAAFEKSGLAAEIRFLPGPEILAGAKTALERARAGAIDAVVVGGGDGTIRTVAGVFAGTGMPFGVLPLGTLNHFAKEVRIPTALDEAVQVIAAGHIADVDAGEVNGQLFVNNSSIGIYPYIVLDRERTTRIRGWQKWSALALGVLRVLRRFPVRRLNIIAEGHRERCRTPCVFVGNNEYALNFRAFGKRDRLDEGVLCLYVAKTQRPLALVWLAIRALMGSLDAAEDLEKFKVSHAEIRSRTSRIPVALDGEVRILHPPLRYRTLPQALRVFAPEKVG